MIIPIKHAVDQELIRQRNQRQINKDNIRENINRVEHNYKVRDKFIIANDTAYKYETPYTGPFSLTRCFTNGTVSLQCGTKNIMYDMCHIKPYKSDTKVEDISSKNISDDINV